MSSFLQLQDRVLREWGASDSEARDVCKDKINDTIYEIDEQNRDAPHLQASDTSQTTTAGSRSVTLPSDYDHNLNIKLTVNSKDRAPLVFYPRVRFIELSRSTTQDIPTMFTIWDNEISLHPIPKGSYTVKMDYYKFSTILSADGDTCLLTDRYPRWEHIIIKGAVSKMHDYFATDQQQIKQSLAIYEASKRRFKAWINDNYGRSPEGSRIRGWKEAARRSPNPFIDLLSTQ